MWGIREREEQGVCSWGGTAWCEISEAKMGKEDIKASEMVCCFLLESKQGEEEIYVEGQPSMSCWSPRVLTRVSMQEGGLPRVESQSLSRLWRASTWRGCIVWGIAAHNSVLWKGKQRNGPLWQNPQSWESWVLTDSYIAPWKKYWAKKVFLGTELCYLGWGDVYKVKLFLLPSPMHPNLQFFLFCFSYVLKVLCCTTGLSQKFTCPWLIV